MPTCPACGGTKIREIALGYYECTTESTKPDMDGYPVTTVCGQRFQAPVTDSPSGQQLCECGMLAIGRCSKCGSWVCGTHSQLVSDRLLCAKHANEIRREQEAAAQARRREYESGLAKARQRYREVFVAALDRFVLAAREKGNPKAERLKRYTYDARERGIVADMLLGTRDGVWRARRTEWSGWYLCDDRHGLRDAPQAIWLTTDGKALKGGTSNPRDYEIFEGKRREAIAGMADNIDRFARRLESDLAGIWDEGSSIFDSLARAGENLFRGSPRRPEDTARRLAELHDKIKRS